MSFTNILTFKYEDNIFCGTFWYPHSCYYTCRFWVFYQSWNHTNFIRKPMSTLDCGWLSVQLALNAEEYQPWMAILNTENGKCRLSVSTLMYAGGKNLGASYSLSQASLLKSTPAYGTNIYTLQLLKALERTVNCYLLLSLYYLSICQLLKYEIDLKSFTLHIWWKLTHFT